jgi:hypothetical protein
MFLTLILLIWGVNAPKIKISYLLQRKCTEADTYESDVSTSIRHSRSFWDRVGYDFFFSCWTN